MLRNLVLTLSLSLSLLACESDPAPGGDTAAGAGGSATAGGQGGSAGKASGGSGAATAGTGGQTNSGGSAAGSSTAGSPAAGSAGAPAAGAGGAPAGGASPGGAGGAEAGAAGEGGSGGAPIKPQGCDIAPLPGEFYELEAESLEQLDPIKMCEYRGKVTLVVNVASKCGYTPQYTPMQQLYSKYKEQGFVILGFPCAQFGNQEFADDKDISAFCTDKYGINFPMFSRIDVNGANEHPVYTWLKSQPGGSGDIPWNFTKFLLGRDGKLIKRIATETPPDDPSVIKLIEEALAQNPLRHLARD